MALNLTGIQNENEFYTTYYLQEVLEKNLKETFGEWAEEAANGQYPHEVLDGMAGDYFQKRNQFIEARSPAQRLDLQRTIEQRLMKALGYDFHPQLKQLDDGRWLPIIAQVNRPNGTPALCVVEAPPAGPDDEGDPLQQTLTAEQFEGLLPEQAGPNAALSDYDTTQNRPLRTPLADLVTQGLFALDDPPRWVLVVDSTQVVLLDRNKWVQKRLLRFEVDEILGRKNTTTLKATAALLHRHSTCPDEGMSLLDTFNENAHKHAFGVSENLKYALRESIELIGNEAIWYLQNVRKEKTYEGTIDPDQLTTECLRYMYRILFLFYIEARPELGYAPMKSETYLKGYSLEHLRELELVNLTRPESQNGHYIHHSLHKLFELVFNGYPATDERNGQSGLDFESGDDAENDADARPALNTHAFRIAPLRAHIFDPERTPLLNKVKFRDRVLQQVIRRMSLSNPDRRGSAERISYAALGINQLGAVYEALLSYSGFFAEEDLYEVKKADEDRDTLEAAYFVPEAELDTYAEDEIVFDDDGTPLMYEKGTFIYRLAGREREKSASYYTPQSLTECLVRYALKELIGEDSSDMPADDILELTVCEPAMGSGAFLNEAVNQLAEAYLQRKQDETGTYISHEDYAREKQKVKMYLADNNVFGVDLNPVATELAEVSLWLNTIYEQTPEDPEYTAGGQAFVPWFGMQLTTGNSLIGARRQVYDPELVKDSGGRGKPAYMETAPERVEPGEASQRPSGHIYHFLLHDYEMANYSTSGGPGDLAKAEIKSLRSWRRRTKKGIDDHDLKTLQRLSKAVDSLWAKHTRQQRQIRERTTDPIHIYGQPVPDAMRAPTTTRWKDQKLEQELYSQDVRASSAYRRLKLAMDYWCALWFWPIDAHDTVPSWDEWLMDLQVILEGDLYTSGPEVGEQQALFPDTMTPDAKQLALELKDEHGFVNVDTLCERNPRLKQAQALAERYKFLHWELEYADLFDQRGGFDLTIGNPPWVKVTWDEQGLLADSEPKIDVRGWSKKKVSDNRVRLIEENDLRTPYLSDYEAAEGTQAFQNAVQNYPLLKGMQTNSYKCFLPQAWMIGRKDGITAFLHPEGIYDDPKGGQFRKSVYKRLISHYQFQNEHHLFPIYHRAKFSINTYLNSEKEQLIFDSISNLFTPNTIDDCYSHSGKGPVPGIKDDSGDWNTRGHLRRIIEVDKEALQLFVQLYDQQGTPLYESRLPALHSDQIMGVAQRFQSTSNRIGDLGEEYFSLEMWHETNEQENGTLSRNTQFPSTTYEWVLSGPHFFVANPFFQTPREKCETHRAYDPVSLRAIQENYLPRTNYIPDCGKKEYVRRAPSPEWSDGTTVLDHYRVTSRRMLSHSNVRTLISAILPRGAGHINTAFSVLFRETHMVARVAALFASLPYDFFLRTTGKGDFRDDVARQMPLPASSGPEVSSLDIRALLLNGLSTHYADLWAESWDDAYTEDAWTKDDPRLNADTAFADLTDTWNWDTPLRTRYARRQALVELDVLSAMALGLTLEELQTIYRVQFPVLRKYEQNTWYDQNGRIIYTKNRGLTGVGFKSKKWKEVKDMTIGTVEQVIEDDTQPGGPVERTIVYEAPFTKCDREADYEQAWGVFAGRGSDPEQT